MSQEPFSVFKQYSNKDQVEDLIFIFEQNSIPFKILDNSKNFDATFSGNAYKDDIQISIPPKDFIKANTLLEESYNNTIEQFDDDHYLFEFSNEELFEILSKSDEWNDFDYKLSQKILKDRGEHIDDSLLKRLKDNRLAELTKTEPNQDNLILKGYIFSILGGAGGIFIALLIYRSKKVLPNGTSVYSYSEEDRKSSKKLLVFSSITSIIFFILYNFISNAN